MTAPKIFDRVKDSTATTGTGTITLANSAPSGYQTWASAGVSNGDYIKYCIAGQSSGLWEVGFGVYNSAGPTITRVATQVEAGSSGAGALVNLTGTSDVFSVDSAVSHGGNAIYGDQSNGSLVFDGTSIVAGVTPSANTYTLAQHIYGTIITINSGVTIKTNGYGIFGMLLINNGTIHADGGNASGATVGASMWPGGSTSRPLAGGIDGLVGRTTIGAGGQPAGIANSYGGSGGPGGADGQGHAGGGIGTNNAPNATVGAARHFPLVANGGFISRGSSTVSVMTGGNGGASGAFNTGTSSGAGGGGGGQILLVCKIIINNGSIHSNGGNGGNAIQNAGVGDAGGGGGGGGGFVVCVYNQYIGSNPTASGGSPGTGVGTGSTATAGGSGTIFLISNS